MAVQTQILHRRGTAASWTSTNPTLGAGEIGFETDTGKYKIGDGSSVWTSLAYASILPNTVTTKGDLLAATGNATVTRQAVGTDGSVLMADSNASTGVSYSPSFGFSAGKNKIINGDFGIWQRGTTFNNAADQTFTADRYLFGKDGTATCNITQQTFTPGAAPVSGYESQYYLRFECSAWTSSDVYIGQKIEDVRTFAGQTITVSFWAKANSAFTNTVLWQQSFGSGGSTGVVGSSTVSIGTSWTRVSATFTLPSISGKTIQVNSFLQIQFLRFASTKTVDIWGLQVEAGSTATPFQTATGTIQGELAACQRYYYRTGVGNGSITATAYEPLGYGSFSSSTVFGGQVEFPVSMRAATSSVDFSNVAINDTASVIAATNVTVNQGGTKTSNINVTVASGGTQYRFARIVNNNNTAGYLAWSAEL